MQGKAEFVFIFRSKFAGKEDKQHDIMLGVQDTTEESRTLPCLSRTNKDILPQDSGKYQKGLICKFCTRPH